MSPTWPAWLHTNAWDDVTSMARSGMDDVDDVPEPNRPRPPTAPEQEPTP